METKRLAFDALELKFDDTGYKFGGYASVFGGVDAYGDTIDPKAYNRTIKRSKADRPIRMRWNHYGPVIGKWTDMRVDEKGLYVEGELTPNHSVAMDVWASMQHGAVDGMSIGYIPKKIEMLGDEKRLLKEIDLVEISVVEDPADLGAKITGLKSSINECQSIKDIESLLRDACGFSKADATALVGRIKRVALGDQGAEPEDTLVEFLRKQTLLNTLAARS